jgi:translocation and assembly module TamB
MSRILKYILFSLTGLFVLILLLLLFTQTAAFRQIVRHKVLKAANEQINGFVTFDRLEGNFFSSLTIHDFRAGLTDKDTLLAFDHLTLRYSAWPLLSGTVLVHSIELEKPRFTMEQGADSTFTFLKLFPQNQKADTVPAKPFKLRFILGQFNINNGYVRFGMNDTIVPACLSDFNLEVAGNYSSKGLNVDLNHLGFLTPSGIPDVKHFQVSVALADSIWSVRDLALVTPRNRLGAEGRYVNMERFNVLLNTDPLLLDEFEWVVPDFRIGVSPEIELTSHVNKGDLFIDLALINQQERIGLKGHVMQFSRLMTDSLRHLSTVDVSLSFQNISLEKWLLLTDLPLLVNGDIQLTGNGLAGSNNPMHLRGNFAGSRWEQHRLRDLSFDATYLDGATKARSRIATNMGTFNVDASANLSNTQAPFKLKLKAQNFPADRFLPEWGQNTLLNMDVTANGAGNDARSLTSAFSVLLSKSVAAHVPVDTLMFEGRFDKGHISIDTLRFLNASVQLQASGTYDDKGFIDADFRSGISDFDAFAHYVEVPARWKKLSLQGHANGLADSLLLDIVVSGDSLIYDTLAQVATFNLSGFGQLAPGGFNGRGNLNIQGLEASGQRADSLTLEAAAKPDEWDALLSVWMPDSMSWHMHALGNMTSPFEFNIPVLDIRTLYDDFSIENGGIHIFMDSTRMEMSDFYLKARRNGRFHIQADGRYLPGDSVFMDVSVEQFDLRLLQRLALLDMPVSGMASVRINADGPLSKPAFDMKMQLDSLAVRELRIKKLNLDVEHKLDSLRAFLVVHSSLGDSIFFRGASPMYINLTDSQMVSTIHAIDGRLLVKDLHPSAFFELENPGQQLFNAVLNADVTVGGNIARPVLRGRINVANGEVSYPAYGIRYRDLKLITRLDSNRVVIDSLFVRHEKGTMLASGNVAFDTSLVSGSLSGIDLSLKAKDFYLSRHRNHEIQINADAWLKTRNDAPVYGGKLTVLRSSFYLPALFEMGGHAEMNKPMLVQALEENIGDSLALPERDSLVFAKNENTPKNNLLQGLTGKINVHIPRNSWVKSEDMNLELYGDFDLLKNKEYFEIFGTLGISRGYYTLYGRKLIIREGELTFQGGEDFNPRVNMRAAYQFRGKDKQKNELIMTVDGTAFELNFSFALNETSITERDAMAYLIFNQSFDQLSFSNQEGVSGNVTSAMLSGLVSSQLTKVIGDKFDLDMVAVQAGDDWESAAFMVGKYITNNLFVTYQRGFGESKEESLTPQTITMEYELTRNVSFRLTQGDVKDSGIDMILKFEKE